MAPGSTVKQEDKNKFNEAVSCLTFPALLRVRSAVLTVVNREDGLRLRAFEDALSEELGREDNGVTIDDFKKLRKDIVSSEDPVAKDVLKRLDQASYESKNRKLWSDFRAADFRKFFVKFWEMLKSEPEFVELLEGYKYGGVSKRLAGISSVLGKLLEGLVYFGCDHKNVYVEVKRLILNATREEMDKLAKDLPTGLPDDKRQEAQEIADSVHADSKQRDLLEALVKQLEMYPQKAAPGGAPGAEAEDNAEPATPASPPPAPGSGAGGSV